MACARSHDANLRALWPEALAARWPDDPNTMSLLKNQILLDPVAACRRSAANAYRHLAMTPENVSFMRGVLEKDPDGSTRFAALNYLGKSGDPSLIPLLVLYLSDPDFLTRFGAFRAVELHITDEVAFSAIVDYLPKEDEDWMRSIFYKDVVNARGDDLRVRDLLLKQAVDDDSEDSRSEILSILAEKYGDDPKVHDLLQARSTDDPSEDVRNMAKELLPKA